MTPSQLWLTALLVGASVSCDAHSPESHAQEYVSFGVITGSPFDQRTRSPTECDVHHQALIQGAVPVVYGLPDPGPPERAALFPNANMQVSGGCMVGDPAQGLVRYCQQCREAHLAWYSERKQR